MLPEFMLPGFLDFEYPQRDRTVRGERFLRRTRRRPHNVYASFVEMFCGHICANVLLADDC